MTVMVSLNRGTLIARYERLRRQLAELDQQLLMLMRADESADDRNSESLARLVEQIEGIDLQLIELERLLPESYEYKSGDE